MTDRNRPWSTDETLAEMQACADALGDLAGVDGTMEDAVTPILELARDAARKRWAYRRAQAQAIEAGATTGCKNQAERDAKILNFQLKPGRTVADVGEEAHMAEAELSARETAIKAVIEQGRLIVSAHVTGREATR